jgi:hypothetical protein
MELPPSAPTADNVILESHDGLCFEVPRVIAKQAKTLDEIMQDLGIENAPSILVSEKIPGKILGRVVQIMKEFYKYEDLKGRKQLDAVQNALGKDVLKDPLSLLYACSFLNYEPGLKLVARYIASRPKLMNIAPKFIRERFAKETALGLLKAIAHYYYLVRGENLEGVDENSYGFSIRDYLDYRYSMPWWDKGFSYQLRLEKLRLNSLEGLESIGDPKKITEINLDYNQLTHLEPGIFQRFVRLRDLYLQFNHLITLDTGIFNGLAQLRNLYLSCNKLRELGMNVFDELLDLERLDMDGNSLTSLPIGIFKNLIKLNRIILSVNRITELRQDVFHGLINLDRINLSGNVLIELPLGIFQGLPNLKWLSLDMNRFKHFPPSLFNGLARLEELNLGSNLRLTEVSPELFHGLNSLQKLNLKYTSLTPENKKQIREALPQNVDVKFE